MERVLARVVGVIGHEQLVGAGEHEGAEHGVDPARGVDDEREILGVGSDEGGEGCAGDVEAIVELAREKAHRLGLHFRAQPGLVVEHFARAGPEEAVIEEDDARVERPAAGEVRAHTSFAQTCASVWRRRSSRSVPSGSSMTSGAWG